MKTPRLLIAVKLFLVLLLGLGLAGCAGKRSASVGPEPAANSPLYRPNTPGAKVVKIQVRRDEYRTRLALGSVSNKARLIKVFSRTARGELPEYRLFDILPESVYQLLGLQSADVLVAAEEVAFISPEKFSGYITLLPELDQGQIEVRRNGSPIVLKYQVVGEKAAPKG